MVIGERMHHAARHAVRGARPTGGGGATAPNGGSGGVTLAAANLHLHTRGQPGHTASQR